MNVRVSELDEKIRTLHATGIGNAPIARALGVGVSSIRYRLNKMGLEANNRRGRPPEPVDDLNSRCKNCKKIVPNDEFPWVRSSMDGRRLSSCKRCRYLQGRELLNSSPEKFFNEKQGRLKNNKKNRSFNLRPGYLYQLWLDQKGLCFYTDKELVATVNSGGISPNSVSVDRLDPTIGYKEGNVVLCCNRVNTIKSDMTLEELAEWIPSWYARVEAYRSIGIPVLQVAPGDF